jgi:hypothetical protein
MGLVIDEEPSFKGRQSTSTVTRPAVIKELTPKNKEFLESLGVTFYNNVGSWGKSAV